MDATEAARVRHHLRDSGVTALWYYAPGFISRDSLDLPQMEALTGFRFDVLKEPGTMIIDVNAGDAGTKLPSSFGVNELHWPRFRVMGTGHEILGEWRDRSGVAFARKSYEGYTSIYVGSAPIPALLLRLLAEEAGVRLWSTRTDIVRATRGAAMLVATDQGTRTLTLSSPMAPVSAQNRSIRHELELEYGDVRLFTV